MIDQNKGDSKSTWKVLKELLPKRSDGGITSLMANEQLVTDFKDICNVFNDYFIDISTKLAASIQTVLVSPLDYLKSFLPEVSNTFVFTSIDENCVLKILRNIPNGKATGLDNIQVRLLKITAPAIASSLTYVINLSLATGKFPLEWKTARISPIHKKG